MSISKQSRKNFKPLKNTIMVATFSDFRLPWLSPDLRETSLTSWHAILLETELIRLKKLTMVKLYVQGTCWNSMTFPNFSLFFSNALTFPWNM